jgi:hypothetical protein
MKSLYVTYILSVSLFLGTACYGQTYALTECSLLEKPRAGHLSLPLYQMTGLIKSSNLNPIHDNGLAAIVNFEDKNNLFPAYTQNTGFEFSINNFEKMLEPMGELTKSLGNLCFVPENPARQSISAEEPSDSPMFLSGGHAKILSSTVEVDAQPAIGVQKELSPLHASRAEIQASAGTYGDFSRYLQLFPGVVFNNDESDDILVRGGNPIENLYLIDGVEVPNINHLSTEGTTGGLVSMIDTSAIKSVDLRTGGYDSSYPERLSSVVSIDTKQSDSVRRTQAEIGIVGAGGMIEQPLTHQGSLLFSAHHSLLNLFTNDIGLNGVPIYTNGLLKASWNASARDQISLLSLSGADSINIHPCPEDIAETNTIDTQYSGWRSTNGIRWQHVYSGNSFGTITLSDSEQHQEIHQQDQYLNNTLQAVKWISCDKSLTPFTPTPIYQEITDDGQSHLHYDHLLQLNHRVLLKAGGTASLMRFDYNVAQPLGAQSPLSIDPARSDSAVFSPHLSSGETGFYAEGVVQLLKQLTANIGGRIQTFALTGSYTATPRLGINYQINKHGALYVAFGDYAQVAPAIYMFAFPQNRFLRPIHARHVVLGANIWLGQALKIKVETYQKIYSNYPVSTEYPSLSLANMVDNLGQQIIWLPLTSQGKGFAEGIELTSETHITNHFIAQANVAYARNEFTGLDDVFRPGNFDYPFVGNLAATYRSGRRYEASLRYEYSSGRPYTPFLPSASLAQNRPIYDTSMINALRGPVYSRLDFQVQRTFVIGEQNFALYGGLENALDRKNFLAYEWMPRCEFNHGCKASYPSNFIAPIYQISRFPNFGIRYAF